MTQNKCDCCGEPMTHYKVINGVQYNFCPVCIKQDQRALAAREAVLEGLRRELEAAFRVMN